MIDLHTHTNESDGTYSPVELIDAAVNAGLEALAITDHDTFKGYEIALPCARQRGFDLVCGIEMSTRMILKRGTGGMKTVHLLGYFLTGPPSAEFLAWLGELQAGRREAGLFVAMSSIGGRFALPASVGGASDFLDRPGLRRTGTGDRRAEISSTHHVRRDPLIKYLLFACHLRRDLLDRPRQGTRL